MAETYQLADVNGRHIGQVLIDPTPLPGTSGNTASIHRVVSRGPFEYWLAKLYSSAEEAREMEPKLRAMLGHPPQVRATQKPDSGVPEFAWPQAILIQAGVPVGFLMPSANNATPLERYLVQETGTSGRELTPAEQSLASRARIGAALSDAIRRLHVRGHLVVDLKPNNVLVYRSDERLCIVDCDEFAIKGAESTGFFPAGELTPEYAAPELLEYERAPGMRPEVFSDRYSLAIVLFELLTYSYPYDGLIDPESGIEAESFADKKAQQLYPYARGGHPSISPPPDGGFECLTDELRDLFERALYDVDPRRRPAPEDWTAALRNFANQIEPCGTDDSDPRHQRVPSFGCPQCLLASRTSRADTDTIYKVDETPPRITATRRHGERTETLPRETQPSRGRLLIWGGVAAGGALLVWLLVSVFLRGTPAPTPPEAPARVEQKPPSPSESGNESQSVKPTPTEEVKKTPAAPAVSVRFTSPDQRVRFDLSGPMESSPDRTSRYQVGESGTFAPGTYKIVATGAQLLRFEQQVTLEGERPQEYAVELCQAPKVETQQLVGQVVEEQACAGVAQCSALFSDLNQQADKLVKDRAFRARQCGAWRAGAIALPNWTLDAKCDDGTLAVQCRIQIAQGSCVFSEPLRSARGGPCPQGTLQ